MRNRDDRYEQDAREVGKIIDAISRNELIWADDVLWWKTASALWHRWQDAAKGEGMVSSHRSLQIELVGIISFLEDGKPDAALTIAKRALDDSRAVDV